MKIWFLRFGMVIGLVILFLSFVNASWLAPAPQGQLKLIANRAAHPLPDLGADANGCPGARIAGTRHSFIANTQPSIAQAFAKSASMVSVDVRRTGDDRLVLFEDSTLDCRTDGSGTIADTEMDRMRALDAGYGYTPDTGRTFPLRGMGNGLIMAVDDLFIQNYDAPFLFIMHGEARDADLLHAAFERAGIEIEDRYGFFGSEAAVHRMRELAPDAWTFTETEVRRCTSDYLRTGWTSFVPESCRNGTIAVPLNYQWYMWGWPNRLIARMESVGARIIVIGDYEEGEPFRGVTDAQRLTSVPESFNGYILVDDIMTIGPALRN